MSFLLMSVQRRFYEQEPEVVCGVPFICSSLGQLTNSFKDLTIIGGLFNVKPRLTSLPLSILAFCGQKESELMFRRTYLFTAIDVE